MTQKTLFLDKNEAPLCEFHFHSFPLGSQIELQYLAHTVCFVSTQVHTILPTNLEDEICCWTLHEVLGA